MRDLNRTLRECFFSRRSRSGKHPETIVPTLWRSSVTGRVVPTARPRRSDDHGASRLIRSWALSLRRVESDFLSGSGFERDEVPTVSAVAIGRNEDLDLVAGLHHPVAIACAIDVITAVGLKFDGACSLSIADLNDKLPMRIHDRP